MISARLLALLTLAFLALSVTAPTALAATETLDSSAKYVCTRDSGPNCVVTASGTACGGDCVLVCALKFCREIRYE